MHWCGHTHPKASNQQKKMSSNCYNLKNGQMVSMKNCFPHFDILVKANIFCMKSGPFNLGSSSKKVTFDASKKVTSKAQVIYHFFSLSSQRVALVVEKASSSPPQSNGSSVQQYIKEEPFFAFSFASLRASFKAASTFLSYSIWTITKLQTPLSSKIYMREFNLGLYCYSHSLH